MCTVEPFPITARWRRCDEILGYAETLDIHERKKYIRKVIRDYVKSLVDAQVAPEKIDRERQDIERLLTMPPNNGGTRLPKAA
jgi:hypothetical protein